MLANRFIDHFGATTLHSPDVFADRDTIHPNIEMRFLVIQYALQPTDASRQLLKEFVDARRVAREPNYLYRSQ